MSVSREGEPLSLSTFEYAPAPESRSVVRLREHYGLFIDGRFVDGGGTPFASIDPATEEVLGSVASASAADVDLASEQLDAVSALTD